MGSSAIRTLILSFTSIRMVVFDARGGQVFYLRNIVYDLKHVTMLFVKFHAPPPYANVQISVVTTPFDPSCVYHCNLLLHFFTTDNYRHIVVPRINAFLCINKINESVPLSFCGP